jgi:type IV pilus assembly protein PilE
MVQVQANKQSGTFGRSQFSNCSRNGSIMQNSASRHRVFEPRSSHGFTLIELMIALVIAAILLSIAVPSYREYVRRGAVASVIETLGSGRVVAEQFFLDNRTYDGMPCPADGETFTVACEDDATTYTITATGSADGPINGFTFDVDEANARSTSGPWGDHACWISRKGDGC